MGECECVGVGVCGWVCVGGCVGVGLCVDLWLYKKKKLQKSETLVEDNNTQRAGKTFYLACLLLN